MRKRGNELVTSSEIDGLVASAFPSQRRRVVVVILKARSLYIDTFGVK